MIVTMRSVAIATAVISGFAVSENTAAAATCPTSTIAYQASGSFGLNVVKGPDKFKLAGEPFSITIDACESLTPVKKGPTYAVYSPLYMTGTVTSGLTGQPTPISGQRMGLDLTVPPSGNDSIQLSGPVPYQGAVISITGALLLPAGTLASTSIAPFPSTRTVGGKSTFSYVVTHPAWQASTVYVLGKEILDPAGNVQQATTAGTSGTTAPVWNETAGGTTTDNTVVWTCQGPLVTTVLTVYAAASGTVKAAAAAHANLLLHTDAGEVITAHADGTQSVRPMHAAPIDTGASGDTVMLRFYASGVRDASEVHVQIAGQDVPVRYSGAAGHFPGLDEVTVDLPRGLAGSGDVDVVLSADGQTASPVRIHIQ